jgi:hypothetical protein
VACGSSSSSNQTIQESIKLVLLWAFQVCGSPDWVTRGGRVLIRVRGMCL